MADSPLRLAVLLSGGGTTLQNLIDIITAGELNASIQVVVSSRTGVRGLQRAADAKITNFVVERATFDDLNDFSKRVFNLIDDAEVDLVVLAGWMSMIVIPPKYAGRVINIHPALLPSFGGKGMFGRRVHQAVLDHGCKISGCTVQFVDDQYDNGPIILQRTCEVRDEDTAETLAARVSAQEKLAYPEAIRLIQAGRLRVEGRRVISNVESKMPRAE